MTDELMMKEAFKEAQKGRGFTSPNPLVGCVIVKNNKIIGRGYHKKAGSDHAEIDALKSLKETPEGATLYSNLEPCCHTNKRTPPCAQRLIKEKIKRVVIANLDPNPEVAGKGVTLLKEAGIEVTTGVLENFGNTLNEVFFTNMKKNRPFIHLKIAQTLDGKIAAPDHTSKWITSEAARLHVHQERSYYDSILVGAKTIYFDDPSLTVRLGGKIKSKIRLILTSSKDNLKNAKVFNDEFKDKTKIITINSSLEELLRDLYQEGITSIYVEGGSQTISTFIKGKLFDKISIYIAPKILGAGLPAFARDVTSMSEALSLKKVDYKILGEDLLITGYGGDTCLQD